MIFMFFFMFFIGRFALIVLGLEMGFDAAAFKSSKGLNLQFHRFVWRVVVLCGSLSIGTGTGNQPRGLNRGCYLQIDANPEPQRGELY
jgi:hypothetical protein